MDVIIAQNMLSWLELLINRYCCIYLVFISFLLNYLHYIHHHSILCLRVAVNFLIGSWLPLFSCLLCYKMMWFLFADWDFYYQDRVTVFVPVFSDGITWFECVTVFSTSWNILILIGYFLCPTSSAFSVSTVGTVLDGGKVFYVFHLDSNHRHQVT